MWVEVTEAVEVVVPRVFPADVELSLWWFRVRDVAFHAWVKAVGQWLVCLVGHVW